MIAKEWLENNRKKIGTKTLYFWDPHYKDGEGREFSMTVDVVDLLTNPGMMSGCRTDDIQKTFEHVLEIAIKEKGQEKS